MPNLFAGDSVSEGVRIAIIVSRYNTTITQSLLDGAVETLVAAGVADDQIDVTWVPGAWELPVATQKMISLRPYSAVICLGAVIRGETTHDTYINSQVSDSLGQLALQHGLPVMFGLLTCQTIEQAKNRAGGRVGNKGSESASAALEMIGLFAKLDRSLTT